MKDDILIHAITILVGALIAFIAAWKIDPLGAIVLAGLILIYIGSLKVR